MDKTTSWIPTNKTTIWFLVIPSLGQISNMRKCNFRAAGVFPLNPETIPVYAFSANIELPTTDEESVSDPGPSTSMSNQPTPTRVLHKISPLPIKLKFRKQDKQVSIFLTSEEHIKKSKIKENEDEKLRKQIVVKIEKLSLLYQSSKLTVVTQKKWSSRILTAKTKAKKFWPSTPDYYGRHNRTLQERWPILVFSKVKFFVYFYLVQTFCYSQF